MEPLDFEALKRDLVVQFPNIKDHDVMSVAMYPHVAKEFLKYRGRRSSFAIGRSKQNRKAELKI